MNGRMLKVLLHLWVIPVLLCGCQGPPDGNGGGKLPPDPALAGFPEGDISAPDDLRDRQGIGAVLVRLPDGRTFLVVLARPRDVEFGASGIDPEVIRTIGPFRGRVVDFESFDVPEELLPPELRDPSPPPGSSEIEEAERRQRRFAASRRFVVITQEEDAGNFRVVVRVYDAEGELLDTQVLEGVYLIARRIRQTMGKTITTEHGGIRESAVVDVQTGKILLGPSAGIRPEDLVDVETLGDGIIVIERSPGESIIRIRVFGPSGEPRFVINIPGDVVKILPNDLKNLKSIVTRFRGTVYNDLIDIVSGRLGPVDANGLAQNGIVGTHKELQYHRVGGEDRFVEAVENTGRNETEIRILNGQGRVIGVGTPPSGRFVKALFVQGKKVFVTDLGDSILVSVIDLATGRRLRADQFQGEFDSIEDAGDGSVTVTTEPPEAGTFAVPLN